MDAGDSRRCIKKRFDLWVSDSTVALHLHQMNLSCQKPCYRPRPRPRESGSFH
ncbi:MAG: winged helix-turn-helix domain-containing protein [Candidatus Competibacteraceae bacterium]|nr:winged helix-turn-helix domain-containing protein [Candidatus Competibacteraceae bacterium]